LDFSQSSQKNQNLIRFARFREKDGWVVNESVFLLISLGKFDF